MPQRRTSRGAETSPVRQAVDDALEVLQADPRRFRELLRNAADLGMEVAGVLDDAGHRSTASKVRTATRSVKGAALLPVGIAAGLVRKALGKILDAVD